MTSSLWANTVPRLRAMRSGVNQKARATVAQYSVPGGKGPEPDFGTAPTPPPEKSLHEYLSALGDTVTVTKDGTVTAPTAKEMTGSIDASIEAGVRDGISVEDIKGQLIVTRANMKASLAKSESMLKEAEAEEGKMPRGKKRPDALVNRISNLRDAVKAQRQAVTHIDLAITKKADEIAKRDAAKKTKAQQEQQRVKDLGIRGSSRSGGRQ
jgi:hypothetical protein